MKKRITSNKFDSKSIGVFSRNDLKTIKGQIIINKENKYDKSSNI